MENLDILERILLTSEFPSTLQLCRSNKDLYSICKSDGFWRQKYLHDFGSFSLNLKNIRSWYERYTIIANVLDQLNSIRINNPGLIEEAKNIQATLRDNNNKIIDDHSHWIKDAPKYIMLNVPISFSKSASGIINSWIGPYTKTMHHYYKYYIDHNDQMIHLGSGSGLPAEHKLDNKLFHDRVMINTSGGIVLQTIFTLKEFLSLNFDNIPRYYPSLDINDELISGIIDTYEKITDTYDSWDSMNPVSQLILQLEEYIPIKRLIVELISYLSAEGLNLYPDIKHVN